MDAPCAIRARRATGALRRPLGRRWERTCRLSAAASRIGQALIFAALLAGWASGAAGCRATVVPPADPRRPVAAYLIDYGRSSGVALPAGDAGSAPGTTSGPETKRLVRYAYGDWKWYALRETGSWSGVQALFWPTTGAFGRGEVAAPARGDPEVLRRTLDAEHVYELTVPAERAALLRDRLDAMHAELGAAGPRAQALGLDFVQHPRRYTFWHNSNHQTAAWLEELGCRVRGARSFSTWRIEPPGGGDDQ